MVRSQGEKGTRAREQDDERKKARELAERTGVPIWGAFRVIRGELSLNDLLKTMLRRDKFRRLRDREGLDADLAGHVASGTLSQWRAQLLQDMRKTGRTKFTRDRLKMVALEKTPVAICRFGTDEWEVGMVTRTRTYDFQFRGDGEPGFVFKHDVKMLCEAAHLPVITASLKRDKRVLQEGLAASRERKDRYRPDDELLARLVGEDRQRRWVLRDGTVVNGRLVAFGRWDVDLAVDDEASVTVFFHALHEDTAKHLK